ncbi:hypothetical protein EVAR_88009_1 [Eumeta japonica]|uniref:Uncharacterized protein n=1 Tax=Eumeta variegata TaxID=151549 RepID=A0A4C1VCT6_EUMVA|nr:hypothetical protein EVAR_88009_1 [Eumeta japonica]
MNAAEEKDRERNKCAVRHSQPIHSGKVSCVVLYHLVLYVLGVCSRASILLSFSVFSPIGAVVVTYLLR